MIQAQHTALPTTGSSRYLASRGECSLITQHTTPSHYLSSTKVTQGFARIGNTITAATDCTVKIAEKAISLSRTQIITVALSKEQILLPPTP